MTRDFHISFSNGEDAKQAKHILESSYVHSKNKKHQAFGYFDLDGNTLFASFIYSNQEKNVDLIFEDVTINLKHEIVFVALKNGRHMGNVCSYIASSIDTNNIHSPIKI